MNPSEMDIVKNESDDRLNLNTFISDQQDSQATKINSSSVDGAVMAIAKSDLHNNKNNIKTSSEQVDDVFNFFINESKRYPTLNFTISKKKVSELIEHHEPNYLKTNFTKMIPAMLRDGVTNPVGLHLHSLETPDSYAMLQKPSVQELAEKKHYENQIELREKSFADEFRRVVDSTQENFWNGLEEDAREAAIAQRRNEMEQGGKLKIPELAIKRSAMERIFWERHQHTWKSLPENERATRAGTVKQSIIKRVYAGEGRALPEHLPERDFLKSVDEMAERLAMISVGKEKQK